MITRNRHRRLIHATRPFANQGASMYVADELPIQYRNLTTESFGRQTLRSEQRPVTTRVFTAAGTAGDPLELTADLSALAPGTVWLDVRHYRDGIENESTHPQKVVLDESGNILRVIRGTAQLLGIEARTGGVVRIRFVYLPAPTGDQPSWFELVCTAGPSAPDPVAVFAGGDGVYELDTAPLLDSDTYAFRIDAVIPAELDEEDIEIVPEVARTLLTLTDVQADATGPAAPTGIILETV